MAVKVKTGKPRPRRELPWHLLVGKRVRAHWNLHLKMWSVLIKGKVVAHLPSLALCDVQFIIRKSGLEKTLETGVRTVHAFAEGIVSESILGDRGTELHWVVYRPDSGFVMVRNGLRVECAPRCELTQSGSCWVS